MTEEYDYGIIAIKAQDQSIVVPEEPAVMMKNMLSTEFEMD